MHRFIKQRPNWDTSCFLQTLGWKFCTSMFWPPAPRMSFINGLSDFTVSTSFQPSRTVTQRFCSGQIWLQWLISTLHQPFPTQTACGLYVLSSSSNVQCVPWTLPRGATIVIQTKLLSTLCSLAPLRICTFKPLAPWRQMELGSCTSPLLSLPSMLAELRTFLGECHSFSAFLTETPHLLFLVVFHTSMLLYRSRPLHSAVLTDWARDLAGAAMFTRSDRQQALMNFSIEAGILLRGNGCLRDQHLTVELWQAPASNSRAFGRKNRKDQPNVQIWFCPALCGDLEGQEACSWSNMTSIYLVYTIHVYLLSKTWFSRVHVMSPALALLHTCWFKVVLVVFIVYFHAVTHSKRKL